MALSGIRCNDHSVKLLINGEAKCQELKFNMDDWSRGETLTVISIIVAVLGFIVAAAVVPEIRRLLGLEAKQRLPSSSNSEGAEEANGRCKIEIKTFELHYTVNGKAFIANEDETIKATKGDALLLRNFEMVLAVESCSGTKIAAEAYMRKPEIRNPNPKNGEYDQDDIRHVHGTRAINTFRSGEFYSNSGSTSWILKDGWNKLLIALIEYSSRYPDGHVITRLDFRISNS